MPAKRKISKEPPSPKEEIEVTEVAPEVPETSSEQELSEETVKTLQERPLEEEVPLERTNRRMYFIGLVVVLVIFGLSGWVFYFANRLSQTSQQEVEVVQPEGAEEPEAVAEPSPTSLSREEISLEILNGSGIAGAAAETAVEFEELGYEILEVGNAEETEGNQLYVAPELEGLVDQLLEDVEEKLEIASISGELTDSTASARIILGKE